MSDKQSDIFYESEREAQEEKNYFEYLLRQSLINSRAKMGHAMNLRRIAGKCMERGYISLDDYATICEKNGLLLF
jgi:hypothetical protein